MKTSQDGKRDLRASLMTRRYSGGATLRQIGAEFGVSGERVRQILKESGLGSTRLKARALEARRQRTADARAARIARRYLAGTSTDRLCAEFHISRPALLQILTEKGFHLSPLARTRTRKATPPRFQTRELIRCLVTASNALGGVLSAVAYTRFAAARKFSDGRKWPTHQTMLLRFGSWRGGLEAAGLATNPSSPILGRVLFDEAHCIDAILETARMLGHSPTAAEYGKQASEMRGALPSMSTVRHRLGTWASALHRAGEFAGFDITGVR